MNEPVDVSLRVAAPDHVRFRNFGGDLVLVDLERGEYFSLDAVGARMWELLVSGQTPAAISTLLVGEYATTESELLRDCTRLLGELLRRGLVVVRP